MKTSKEIIESRFENLELNLQISEELHKVMNKYDVRYLKYLTNSLNRIIQLSEQSLVSDSDVEELTHSLIFVLNNLNCENSLSIYTSIIDELNQVIEDVQYENEFNDNVVNI